MGRRQPRRPSLRKPRQSPRQIATGHGTDERGLAYLSTGGEARVSKDGDWSETYACNLFDWHLKVQETLPWFTGSAQWIFKDFTTPLRIENPVPRVNQKGLITRDMHKKEAYYVFQSYWSDVPMAQSTATAGPSAGASQTNKKWSRSTPTATPPSSSSTANPPE